MEANGSGQKVLVHFLVKTDGGLHQRADHTTHTVTVTAQLEVTAQNTAVYSAQSVSAREMNSEHGEMPLKRKRLHVATHDFFHDVWDF